MERPPEPQSSCLVYLLTVKSYSLVGSRLVYLLTVQSYSLVGSRLVYLLTVKSHSLVGSALGLGLGVLSSIASSVENFAFSNTLVGFGSRRQIKEAHP